MYKKGKFYLASFVLILTTISGIVWYNCYKQDKQRICDLRASVKTFDKENPNIVITGDLHIAVTEAKIVDSTKDFKPENGYKYLIIKIKALSSREDNNNYFKINASGVIEFDKKFFPYPDSKEEGSITKQSKMWSGDTASGTFTYKIPQGVKPLKLYNMSQSNTLDDISFPLEDMLNK